MNAATAITPVFPRGRRIEAPKLRGRPALVDSALAEALSMRAVDRAERLREEARRLRRASSAAARIGNGSAARDFSAKAARAETECRDWCDRRDAWLHAAGRSTP